MTKNSPDSARLMTVVSAAAFGVAYNRLVAYLEDDPHFDHDLLVSVEVAFGVAMTVVLAAICGYITWTAARRVLVAFVASGTVMMLESMKRAIERERAYAQTYRNHRA